MDIFEGEQLQTPMGVRGYYARSSANVWQQVA